MDLTVIHTIGDELVPVLRRGYGQPAGTPATDARLAEVARALVQHAWEQAAQQALDSQVLAVTARWDQAPPATRTALVLALQQLAAQFPPPAPVFPFDPAQPGAPGGSDNADLPPEG